MRPTPTERWQRIEKILDRALDLGAEERRDFVAQACADDERLREEVQSLLRADEASYSPLDSSPVSVSWLGRLVAGARLPTAGLAPGARLGKYEIESLIGSGGMGEVYLAVDRDLKRWVAIKVLPELFVEDVERLNRFRREARILASLNHPNIGGIHGLEHEGDQPFLVLEFVPGETLSERLARGALRMDDAFDVGAQIARALEVAHARGVVHRDLKPANIKLTPESIVKVLDFGIAKTEHGKNRADLTGDGVILGTVSYMSPEQARGKTANKQADVWSFGVVLREMLTGRNPFEADTPADVVAAVLSSELPREDLPLDLPREVAVLLDRCLTRDPDERLQDIGEARRVLERAATDVSSSMTGGRFGQRAFPWVRAASLALVAALAVAGVMLVDPPSKERPEAGSRAVVGKLAGPPVAVVPFTNASGDPAHDHFGLGLADDLIFGLMQQKSFPVIPREATWSFRDSTAPPSEIARQLGAAYLVDGTVRRVGNRLRVIANLTDAEGKQVWARRFEREEDVDEVLAMSDQLIASVAGALLGSEIERVHRSVPVGAWELYVKALGVMLDYEPTRFEEARRYAEEATRLAPEMAEAWWARGELQVWHTMFHASTREEYETGLELSIQYLGRAHELSPFHAGTCGCLGVVLTALGRPEDAKIVFEEAVEANPYSAPLRVDYSVQLAAIGEYERARAEADIALELDPVSQERAVAWMSRAVASLNLGNERDALEAARRSLMIDRYHWSAASGVGVLYLLGEKEEAAQLLDDLVERFPNLSPLNPLVALVLKGPEDALVRYRSGGRVDLPADMLGIFEELGWKDPVIAWSPPMGGPGQPAPMSPWASAHS